MIDEIVVQYIQPHLPEDLSKTLGTQCNAHFTGDFEDLLAIYYIKLELEDKNKHWPLIMSEFIAELDDDPVMAFHKHKPDKSKLLGKKGDFYTYRNSDNPLTDRAMELYEKRYSAALLRVEGALKLKQSMVELIVDAQVKHQAMLSEIQAHRGMLYKQQENIKGDVLDKLACSLKSSADNFFKPLTEEFSKRSLVDPETNRLRKDDDFVSQKMNAFLKEQRSLVSKATKNKKNWAYLGENNSTFNKVLEFFGDFFNWIKSKLRLKPMPLESCKIAAVGRSPSQEFVISIAETHIKGLWEDPDSDKEKQEKGVPQRCTRRML